MKAKRLELIAIGVASALSAQLAPAQSSDQSAPPKPQGQSGQMSAQSTGTQTGEVRLSKLLGADVKSGSDEDLGKIKDLVVDPETGAIRFAVLGRGGVFGIAEKRVPVPWQAASIQSENEITLNLDKEKLRSAPTINSDYSDLNNPGYLVSVYQFYEIQQPAVGAAGETPGGTTSGKGASPGNSKENAPQRNP